jgi:hypothetical protein
LIDDQPNQHNRDDHGDDSYQSDPHLFSFVHATTPLQPFSGQR